MQSACKGYVPDTDNALRPGNVADSTMNMKRNLFRIVRVDLPSPDQIIGIAASLGACFRCHQESTSRECPVVDLHQTFVQC